MSGAKVLPGSDPDYLTLVVLQDGRRFDVSSIAANAYQRGRGRFELEDAQQAAICGVLKADEHWDQKRGTAHGTGHGAWVSYARTWAYQEAQELLRQPECFPEPERMDERYEAPAAYEEDPEDPRAPGMAGLVPALPEPHRTCARIWSRGGTDADVLAELELTSAGRGLLSVVRRDLRWWLAHPGPVAVQPWLPVVVGYGRYWMLPYVRRRYARRARPAQTPVQLELYPHRRG